MRDISNKIRLAADRLHAVAVCSKLQPPGEMKRMIEEIRTLLTQLEEGVED